MVANPKSLNGPMAGAEGITHALLAVDGSPASLRAAERLSKMLRAYPAARLTLMYVAHLPRDLQVSATGAKLTLEFPVSRMAGAAAAPALQAAIQALGSAAIRAEQEVQIGEPAQEIVDYAATEGVDLIVMGIKGTSELPVGSISTKVLTLAPCPVMLVQ